MEGIRSYAIPLGLIALATTGAVWAAQKPLHVGILLAALALGLAGWIYKKNGTEKFLLLLAFSMPLSFELPLGGSAQLIFPAEPLTAVAAVVLCFELMNNKSLLFSRLKKHAGVVLVFVMGLVCATLANGLEPISVKYSLVFLGYLATYFLLMGMHASSIPKLLGAYTIGLVPVALWSLWQWHGYGFNPITVKGIFLPFFKDHTILGATTALLGTYWVVRARFHSTGWAWAAALFCFGLAYLSGSRAAWWSVVFASALLLVHPLRLTLRTALGLVGIALAVGAYQWSHLVEAMEANTHQSRSVAGDDLDKALSATNLQSDESNVERLNRWHAAWEMFKEKPFTGHGPGMYQFVYHPYQTPKFYNRLTVTDPWHIPENSGGSAHSEFLLALSEQGVGGGVAWILFWFLVVWFGFGATWSLPPPPSCWMLFLPLVTYLLHSQANNFLTSASFAFPFWLVASLLFTPHERVLHQG